MFVGEDLPAVLQHGLEHEGLLFVQPVLHIGEREGFVGSTSKSRSVIEVVVPVRSPSTSPPASSALQARPAQRWVMEPGQAVADDFVWADC